MRAAGCRLAKLDVLLSLSLVAAEMRFTRPLLSSDNVIAIAGGRHPLMERNVETFVPNDTLCAGGMVISHEEGKGGDEDEDGGEDADTDGDGDENGKGFPSLCVITGANYSGKSVYLRQVALIAMMSHIGSFVPATRCVIGPIDRIFTRISSNETSSVGLSSFSVDASQIASALKFATRRSLLLLDEFGKGTDALDGQA